MDIKAILSAVDHTLLAQTATRAQIDALAVEMKARGCELLLALKQMPA